MNANHLGIPRAKASVRKYGTAWAIVLGCLLFAVTARAQNSFNSGSTGADGAFAPTTSQSIAVPTSGTFNFTTVNIPSGVTITFTRNSTNSPLTILASGDVVIAGNINIDGQTATANGAGALGGPGGSSGGAGGYGFDAPANHPGGILALISRFPEFQAMAQVAAAGAAAFRPESPVRAVAAGLEVPAEQVRTRAR